MKLFATGFILSAAAALSVPASALEVDISDQTVDLGVMTDYGPTDQTLMQAMFSDKLDFFDGAGSTLEVVAVFDGLGGDDVIDALLALDGGVLVHKDTKIAPVVLGDNILGSKAPEVASLPDGSGFGPVGIRAIAALDGPMFDPATRPVDWRPIFT